MRVAGAASMPVSSAQKQDSLESMGSMFAPRKTPARAASGPRGALGNAYSRPAAPTVMEEDLRSLYSSVPAADAAAAESNEDTEAVLNRLVSRSSSLAGWPQNELEPLAAQTAQPTGQTDRSQTLGTMLEMTLDRISEGGSCRSDADAGDEALHQARSAGRAPAQPQVEQPSVTALHEPVKPPAAADVDTRVAVEQQLAAAGANGDAETALTQRSDGQVPSTAPHAKQPPGASPPDLAPEQGADADGRPHSSAAAGRTSEAQGGAVHDAARLGSAESAARREQMAREATFQELEDLVLQVGLKSEFGPLANPDHESLAASVAESSRGLGPEASAERFATGWSSKEDVTGRDDTDEQVQHFDQLLEDASIGSSVSMDSFGQPADEAKAAQQEQLAQVRLSALGC